MCTLHPDDDPRLEGFVTSTIDMHQLHLSLMHSSKALSTSLSGSFKNKRKKIIHLILKLTWCETKEESRMTAIR